MILVLTNLKQALVEFLKKKVMGMNDTNENSLTAFHGTYRGVSPNFKPPMGVGELEVTISESYIVTKKATGLVVEEDQISTSLLKAMDSNDLKNMEDMVQSMFISEEVHIGRCKGYEGAGVTYVFFPPEFTRGGLMVFGSGPMPEVLFSPEQIQKGQYTQMVDLIEADEGKGSVPTLANGGKAVNPV